MRRLPLGVDIWLGGFFLEGVGVAWVGVFARLVGVFDRFVGVFARVVGSAPCCRVVRPPAGPRLAGPGELDLVETGLLGLEGLVTFFIVRGMRDEAGRLVCVCRVGSNVCPARLPARSLWVLACVGGFLVAVPGEGTPRYQLSGTEGSAFALGGKFVRVGLRRFESDVLLGRIPSIP